MPSDSCVVERAQRARVHVREQHAHGEPLGVVPVRRARSARRGHVGDDDAGLGEQSQLQPERGAPRGREERAPPELLRHDHRHEVRLAARQPPHLLEDRVHAAVVARQHLEPRLSPGEVPPARADPGVGVRARARAARADRRRRAICRAYQSAPSVATSIESTQSSTSFVGRARRPARRRCPPAAAGRSAGSAG